MEKVIMITQDNCVKCTALKQFLEFGLNNKYQDNIEIVKREENEENFMNLVTKHNIQASPALIYKEQVLLDCTPSNVMGFLENL